MPCLNSPFVLMSVFEEFVSRMLYMHFYTGGGGEISLPEAHHAASRVMQAITSRERSSKNSQFFSYFCVINHLKLSFFFFLPHKEFTTFNTSDNLLCPRIYMRLYGVHPSCHRTGINSQLQPKLDKWKEMDGQKDFKDL